MENKCTCWDPNAEEKAEMNSRQTLPPALTRPEGIPFKRALREQQHEAWALFHLVQLKSMQLHDTLQLKNKQLLHFLMYFM